MRLPEIPTGRCPTCKQVLKYAQAQEIHITRGIGEDAWHGTTFVCPHCSTILNLQVTPTSESVEENIEFDDEISEHLKRVLARTTP